MLGDIADALQAMRSAAVAAQNGGLTTEEKQALQTQYLGWVEYMDIIAQTVTFDGAFLFDGAYGMTCPDPGAPAVSIPEVTPKSLNVGILNLVSAAADAQAAIEAAQSTVSAHRATLASQQSTVAGLLP
jgi:flagellin-like hook-associated protein FlgL